MKFCRTIQLIQLKTNNWRGSEPPRMFGELFEHKMRMWDFSMRSPRLPSKLVFTWSRDVSEESPRSCILLRALTISCHGDVSVLINGGRHSDVFLFLFSPFSLPFLFFPHLLFSSFPSPIFLFSHWHFRGLPPPRITSPWKRGKYSHVCNYMGSLTFIFVLYISKAV